MLRLNAPLLALTGAFTGPFAPFQAIHLRPAPAGGVVAMASDCGKVTAFGHDPKGELTAPVSLIAGTDLLAACRGIKGAERELVFDGIDTATVTTYRKTKSEAKTFKLLVSDEPEPPLRQALAACLTTWGAAPCQGDTAGRYATTYLEKAIRAAGSGADSLLLCAFTGGPLRLQLETLDLLVLLMPQTAEPIPPLPAWAVSFAAE